MTHTQTTLLHIAGSLVAALSSLALALALPAASFADAPAPDAPAEEPSAPMRPTSLELSPGVHTIRVSWNQAVADGIEIAYATKAQRAKGTWQSKRLEPAEDSESAEELTETRAATLKKLIARKAYYVRARSFAETSTDERVYSAWTKAAKTKTAGTKWQARLDKYRWDTGTGQLLFVQHTSGAHAKLKLFVKKNPTASYPTWEQALSCKGYVGRNGIAKKREGDLRTPTGTFRIVSAFGIKKDPGALLTYTKVNRYLYWCGDKKWYNRLVDLRKQKHACNGEHLIDYKVFYDYALTIDFNTKPVKYKRGSAIFIHCAKAGHPYTAGCVSMKKRAMLKVIRSVGKGARVCIYEK